MLTLLPTIVLLCGKVNFRNLSRYSDLSEKTYRRHYSQAFNFIGLNAGFIERGIRASANQIAVMDCSFIAKSGNATSGLDWFYNSSASRSEKGLEISVLAVVDVEAHRGYTLSLQQTPANPIAFAHRRKPSNNRSAQADKTIRVDATLLPQIKAHLDQLPPKAKPIQSEDAQMTRIDHYLTHLKQSQPYLPKSLKYLVVDGFYSKQKFVDGVCQTGLEMIGKLRIDANLRYLYDGPQQHRGRPRTYDGKVDLNHLTRFTWVGELEANLNLYSTVVWHVSLKRKLRIACLVDTRKPGKTGLVLLFSTDVDLEAEQIIVNYKARFQIEFIFREAKQFTGLCDCQSRDAQKLDFHFNAALSALNLARYDAQLRQTSVDSLHRAPPFSMASHKRVAFNDHLLERFIAKLDLNPTLIKSNPNYENLRTYGILAS